LSGIAKAMKPGRDDVFAREVLPAARERAV
jgi:hypothetical protein